MDQAAKLFSAQNLDVVNAPLKIPCLVAGMAQGSGVFPTYPSFVKYAVVTR